LITCPEGQTNDFGRIGCRHKNEDGRVATEAEVSAFEEKIGTPRPDSLREYFLQSGGGRVFDPPVIYLDAKEREFRLRHMGSLAETAQNFMTPRSYPLPRELLIIGNDAGGNSIMICTRRDRFGEIFMLDHELVAYEGEPEELEAAEEYGLVTSYSESFAHFLGDLRIEEY